MRSFIVLLFGIIFAVSPFFSFKSIALSDFNISCELDENHKSDGGDTDRVTPEREIEIMEIVLNDLRDELGRVQHQTVDNFGKKLEAIYDQLPWFIDHSSIYRKTFMGFSAEDDSKYVFPNTDFFPKGKIRNLVTEEYIRLMDLGLKLGKENQTVNKGVLAFGKLLIVHEATHAWQYHTHPVRDIGRFSNVDKEGNILPPKVDDLGREFPAMFDEYGVPSKELLQESEKKIEYEHDAFYVHRSFASPYASDIQAFQKAFLEYRKAHPKEFEEGAPYYMLREGAPRPVETVYLGGALVNFKLGREFTPNHHLYYYGQIVPAQIVRKLVEIRDGKRTAQASEFADMRKEWDKFINGPVREPLLEDIPLLADMEVVYKKLMNELDPFLRD